jgi:tRNA A58 N-methylase Trm61
MMPPRPTELARMILGEWIHEGDLVIDATAGNGHDTVFLAQCVAESGRVLAFDVQEAAIRSASLRVAEAGLRSRVEFHLTSHARMADFAGPGSVAAVMFNLGYLPGEDHALATGLTETLSAMDAAAELIKPRGVLCVICYPGHAGGAEESAAVERKLASLAHTGWRLAKYSLPETLKPAPFLLLAAKP